MRRLSKAITFSCALILALAAADVLLVMFFAKYRPEIKKSDAVIILGAAINTPALYNRTLEGLEVYEQGKADVLVLSGGKISETDISEAGYMEKVIKRTAEKQPPLILEDQSHNTEENIYNSKAKIPDAKSVVVVSDEFHLARAVLLAKRAGFEKVYWSSPNPVYYSQKELNRYYAREMVAMIAYIPVFLLGK